MEETLYFACTDKKAFYAPNFEKVESILVSASVHTQMTTCCPGMLNILFGMLNIVSTASLILIYSNMKLRHCL